MTGQEGQPLDGPVIHHEPQLGGRDAEAGIGRGNAQITCDRQLGAGSERGTVHCCDHGLGDVAQRGERGAQRLHERRVLDVGEVGPRAEVLTRAGEHEDPRVVRVTHRVDERTARVLIDRVAAFLPVERDEADRAATLDTYHRARLTTRRSRR